MAEARTAIITGATSGLGLECSRALVSAGWHVVLAVRNTAAGSEAAASLGDPARAQVMELDLASLDSVRRFSSAYSTQELPPLRAIVCNAGVQALGEARSTADGFELTFGTNHLGHFALVEGLRNQLVAPARIVVVASDTHDPRKRTGMPDPVYVSAEALARPDPGSEVNGRVRYSTSKLCNVLYSYELDRRLGHGEQGVSVTAFHPGLMPGSGLARDYGTVQRFAWRFVMPALRVLPNVRSTKRSGRELAALAGDPRYEGVTGRYFDGLKDIESSPESYDTAKAADLWDTSERLVAEQSRLRRAAPR